MRNRLFCFRQPVQRRGVRLARTRSGVFGIAVSLSLVLVGGGIASYNAAASAADLGLKIEFIEDGNIDERWSGSIVVPVDGVYQFIVSGDPSDLWIDGVQLVDNWQDESHDRFGKLALQAGVAHDVLLEIKARPGDAYQKLEWSGPSFGRREIPNASMRPTRGNVRNVTWSNPLRNNAAARGVLIGTAVDPDGLRNTTYADVLKREFSLAPPEWAFTAARKTS
jgi:PA14 domain